MASHAGVSTRTDASDDLHPRRRSRPALGGAHGTTPKPLIDIAGEPFLFHQLRLLAEHGAERVVLCVGYRGEMIEERVGTARYGIAIDYSYDSPQLDGTLGAIRRAVPLLGDRFLVLYGDTYLRLDYGPRSQSGSRAMRRR